MKKTFFSGIVALLFSASSAIVSAQSFNMVYQEKERDTKVLSLVTVKKNDTCIKLTALTLKECIDLGKEYGRTIEVFIDKRGKQTYIVPLRVGEQIAFIRYMEGNDIRMKYVLVRQVSR